MVGYIYTLILIMAHLNWPLLLHQAFSATTVSAGQGLGVVVATGDNAEIGKINRLVSTVEDVKTNLVIQV